MGNFLLGYRKDLTEYYFFSTTHTHEQIAKKLNAGGIIL
jgi:hypothetical protein